MVVEGHLSAAGHQCAIIVSRFNSFICERFLEGALDTLSPHGAEKDQQTVVRVPGSFEISLMAKRLVGSQKIR